MSLLLTFFEPALADMGSYALAASMVGSVCSAALGVRVVWVFFCDLVHVVAIEIPATLI